MGLIGRTFSLIHDCNGAFGRPTLVIERPHLYKDWPDSSEYPRQFVLLRSVCRDDPEVLTSWKRIEVSIIAGMQWAQFNEPTSSMLD